MTIKFISLNVWLGGKLLPAVLDFLKREQPDVLVLQEVYNGHDPSFPEAFRSFDIFRKELNLAYAEFAPRFLEILPEGKIDQGNAVFSKFPIVRSQTTFFNESYGEYTDEEKNWPVLPRAQQHVVLDTPDGEVNVLNVHGVWDLDGDNDSPRRRNMSRLITEAIKDQPRCIVAGDTNAKPTNPALKPIEEHVRLVKPPVQSSFNMRRKSNPGYATAVVDLLYVSDDMKVESIDYPDVDVSDHLPLVAEPLARRRNIPSASRR